MQTDNLKAISIKMEFNTADVRVASESNASEALKARLEAHRKERDTKKYSAQEIERKLEKAADRNKQD